MREIINNLLLSIASSQAALNELHMKKIEIASIPFEQLRVSTIADLERVSDFLLQSIAIENKHIKRLREFMELKKNV